MSACIKTIRNTAVQVRLVSHAFTNAAVVRSLFTGKLYDANFYLQLHFNLSEVKYETGRLKSG
jgi:hypothetical protein